jgi:hypothetical protein
LPLSNRGASFDHELGTPTPTAVSVGVNDDAVRSETGQVVFEGASTVNFGTSYAVEEDVANGPFSRASASYTLTGGRDLTITEPGGRILSGVASADEILAGVSSLTQGQDPATMLLVRRDTSPAQTDLAGSWVAFHWGRTNAPGGFAGSGTYDVTIDASGALETSNAHSNLDGDIDPGMSVSIDEELVVSSGGWLLRRRDASSLVTQRGGISADHDVILLARTDGTWKLALIVVLVRVDAAPTDATLDAAYGVAGFESMGTGTYLSLGGTIDTDGLGSGGWAVAVNSDGTAGLGSVVMVYTVHPSGRATFTFPGPVDSWGAVGPSGRFAIFSGYSTPGANPTFNFPIR